MLCHWARLSRSYFVAAFFWPPTWRIGGLDRGKAGCESQDCAVVAGAFHAETG